MKIRKRLVAAGAAAVFLGFGTWAVVHGSADVDYRTAAVDRGDVAYNISASGNLNAVVTVQVGSQVSGNIQALYADFNTRVTKGQLVARIDPAVFQAKVDQATANLNAARAAVANAQATIEKGNAELAGSKASVASA